jgi:hypothetical protein
MAGPLELPAQLEVVPDLAVVDRDDGSVLVHERLRPSLEVDDAEPGMAEGDRPVEMETAPVGPSVDER